MKLHKFSVVDAISVFSFAILSEFETYLTELSYESFLKPSRVSGAI
jgi:hypothetical protein